MITIRSCDKEENIQNDWSIDIILILSFRAVSQNLSKANLKTAIIYIKHWICLFRENTMMAECHIVIICNKLDEYEWFKPGFGKYECSLDHILL